MLVKQRSYCSYLHPFRKYSSSSIFKILLYTFSLWDGWVHTEWRPHLTFMSSVIAVRCSLPWNTKNTRAIRKVTSGQLLSKQQTGKTYYIKNTYILNTSSRPELRHLYACVTEVRRLRAQPCFDTVHQLHMGNWRHSSSDLDLGIRWRWATHPVCRAV
jgi:hypothetical protein